MQRFKVSAGRSIRKCLFVTDTVCVDQPLRGQGQQSAVQMWRYEGSQSQ